MTDTISIPLNKFLAWQGNVRKTDTDKGISELSASICAHGLLQSLVVREDGTCNMTPRRIDDRRYLWHDCRSASVLG